MTSLMRRADKGCRVGKTRVYTDGQVKPVIGLQQRRFAFQFDLSFTMPIGTLASAPEMRFGNRERCGGIGTRPHLQ